MGEFSLQTQQEEQTKTESKELQALGLFHRLVKSHSTNSKGNCKLITLQIQSIM